MKTGSKSSRHILLLLIGIIISCITSEIYSAKPPRVKKTSKKTKPLSSLKKQSNNNNKLLNFLRLATKNELLLFYSRAQQYLPEISYYESIKTLLEHRANPNIFDRNDAEQPTPLHKLGMFPHLVDLLLKHGAQPNATNNIGETPLRYLIMEAKHENWQTAVKSAKTLLQYNRDIEARLTATNETILHNVCMQTGEQSEIISKKILYLLNCSANVNAVSNGLLTNGEMIRRTPMHHALYSSNPKAVETLYEGGADLTIKDENGLTPLQLAQGLYNTHPENQNRKECLDFLKTHENEICENQTPVKDYPGLQQTFNNLQLN